MDPEVSSFVDELIRTSSGLADAHRETCDYWSPEDPPVTVALSDLGHRLADDFLRTDDLVNSALFAAIEKAFTSGSPELVTAVGTGMIEGMIAQANSLGIWDQILPMLGQQSARYAVAWNSSGM